MENLEEILKKKKGIILLINIIIVVMIGGIIFLNHKEDNGETINILEKMEQEMGEENKHNLKEKNETNSMEIKEDTEEPEEPIAIHITGEVKKVGILYLDKGARIADAIKAAGGATKNANLNQVNLAYILEDGQKIYIPNKKEKIQQGEYIVANSGQNVLIEESKSSDKKTDNNKNKNKKGVNGKVNINSANQSELEGLKGIGPSLAERIIEYREANGKFEKIEEIQNVKGIGDSKYRNIKDSICI